jgi:hypothetical protein
VKLNQKVVAVSCEMLVDGVVDGLPHEMVKSRTIMHISDVHTGTFAHGFQPLEGSDALRIVAG